MTNKQIIFLGLAVLLVSLVLGGIFFAVATKKNTPVPTPTPTIAPQPTVISATDTPTPSPTSKASPTPTRKPTAAPTNTPSPTHTQASGVVNIEASVNPATSNACNLPFTFSAKIYTNAAMTVKYKWLRSDDTTTVEETLTYSEAGMKTVTTEWTRDQTSGGTSTGWERIQIISPGSAQSNKAEFALTCP